MYNCERNKMCEHSGLNLLKISEGSILPRTQVHLQCYVISTFPIFLNDNPVATEINN